MLKDVRAFASPLRSFDALPRSMPVNPREEYSGQREVLKVLVFLGLGDQPLGVARPSQGSQQVCEMLEREPGIPPATNLPFES